MRKFVPVLLLCAACADSSIVDPATDDDALPPFDDVHVLDPEEPGVPLLVPEVCAVRTWSDIRLASDDVDLGVVGTANGVALFAVERAGGDVQAFAIESHGFLTAARTLRQGSLTAVSAAAVDGTFITASLASDGDVFVDVVRSDLARFDNVSTERGTMIADVSAGDRFAALASTDGVTGIRFDDRWQPSALAVATKPPRAITAARYLDDTIVAWSTDTTCHVARTGRTSSRDFTCVGARLALDEANGRGYMVSADGENIMISDIRIGGESELAGQHLLVQRGSAPKIAFDGSRYWVSYTNTHGHAVVGYLHDGALISVGIDVRPAAEAYDLSVKNGLVWLYAVDDTGRVGAHELCLR